MTRYALEHWSAEYGSWITLGTFASKAEARARGWSLRLVHSRVREVSAISST